MEVPVSDDSHGTYVLARGRVTVSVSGEGWREVLASVLSNLYVKGEEVTEDITMKDSEVLWWICQ